MLFRSMSMARVHREFIRLAANSQSFGKKVSDLGHFEFGPNRKVITVNPEGCKLTETYWAQGDDYRGYLQQWIDVYSFVLRNRSEERRVGKVCRSRWST